VRIDSDGRIGTELGPPTADHGDFDPTAPQSTQPDTKLNAKVEELQKQVAALTAQLKEQAALIQKVSAQLEANKPAPKVVANK
jgi:hypothetical protein